MNDRRKFVKTALTGIVAAAVGSGSSPTAAAPGTVTRAAEFDWPPAVSENRPWTYWWWMGSAVDKAGLTETLRSYRDAGIGGVHVIPIYGVHGYEDRDIAFLSPRWVEMLGHTVAEARQLGMGVDMTTGSGWPFGGPQVGGDAAAATALWETYQISGGELKQPIRSAKQAEAKLQALVAHSVAGQILDLTARVDSAGTLNWTAPPGEWKLYAVFAGRTKQRVKRAAPGGEGAVVDHFSQDALGKYLARFDAAFGKTIPVRALYNDSYEVYGADWTDDFLEAFERRRGYDLKRYLPELRGETSTDEASRVLCDYRETVSDLLLERFIRPWAGWGRAKNCRTRLQAHGSPGNLLDLYAAADVPETEAFGPSRFKIPGLRVDRNIPEHFGRPDTLFNKFASSAAHLTGKRLASSESCTWLGEHFQISLAQVKPEIDRLFVAGVNHIFYHGITYSPKQVPFPGWLFYASTNFGPSNTFWKDLPHLNAYIARCQSVLQHGAPSNDVLLYFPVHDLWQTARRAETPLHYFTAHNADSWVKRERGGWGTCADALLKRGYDFDYVSDRLLGEVKTTREVLSVGGAEYRAVVVAGCRLMPLQTLESLRDLAAGGATVIFKDKLPEDVPGLFDLEARRARFRRLLAGLTPAATVSDIREYKIGRGKFLVGGSVDRMMESAGVKREKFADHDLNFVRRAHADGHHYFVTNLGDKSFEGWFALGARAKSVIILDPRFGSSGLASARDGEDGSREIYMQLPPGQSLILRCFASRTIERPRWKYLSSAGQAFEVKGTWNIKFLEGGPAPPADIKTDELASWTELGGADAKAFSGTALYRIEFERPATRADEWVLDIGEVCESARIRLNGKEAGALWCFPFRMPVGKLLRDGRNTLEIEVTNLPANRVADLARRGVKWANFRDINFVNIKYEPFDASKWTPMASGLLGPVRLLPHSARV